MSARPRCHLCKHPKGARVSNRTKQEPKRDKKAACSCPCHQIGQPITRTEALSIARRTIETAEREREELDAANY